MVGEECRRSGRQLSQFKVQKTDSRFLHDLGKPESIVSSETHPVFCHARFFRVTQLCKWRQLPTGEIAQLQALTVWKLHGRGDTVSLTDDSDNVTDTKEYVA